MSVAIVIPARYASTRYPGKPLAVLNGPDGSKTLIQRSWEAARAVKGIDSVHVATDDARIADTVAGFGGLVIMTEPACANGTERCADALAHLPGAPEIVVNFQGDAPLTPPWFVEALVQGLVENPGFDIATPVLRCDAQTLRCFQEDRSKGRVGGTTAVFDRENRALYFSKEVVPYTTPLPADGGTETVPVFHHVGLYAYRRNALNRYPSLPAGPLESREGLEQLRFLEHGHPVLCVEVSARGRVFWELNNPTDIPRIEEALK